MSDPGSDPRYPFGFDLGPHPRTLQLIWFSFLMVGQAGLALFLLTLFFSKSLAPRLPVFYNFVLLSFFGTPVYLILFYTGEFMNTRPPYAQCLVQAVMKHGIDPAFILSSLLLVIETWKSLVRGPRERTHSPSRGWIMLALPYLNFLLFAIPAALIGLYFPDEVSHGGHSFFCTIVNDTFGAILSLEVALIAIGTLICQVAIWTVLWKRRKVTRTMGVPSSLDTSQIVRISFFNVWETIGCESIIQ
ncbi:hypothetical protein SISNIDRAFT_253708 [Sistotremastrum niveocremeum HHB9708]|uniref:G-protein coupled receptors family 2 profile 2 domain-containing protein n=1 Tax=Sistotremastrum niveocremeum HHB9708 TaxID=1314777 RepID=A0A164PIQ1_9AGAM|nr:hypothetical protein SISNIDRAFT_253708 [Sistotremastrum niveocremeum HHB9708]